MKKTKLSNKIDKIIICIFFSFLFITSGNKFDDSNDNIKRKHTHDMISLYNEDDDLLY